MPLTKLPLCNILPDAITLSPFSLVNLHKLFLQITIILHKRFVQMMRAKEIKISESEARRDFNLVYYLVYFSII